MHDEVLFRDPEKTAIRPVNEGMVFRSGGCRLFGNLLLPGRKDREELVPLILLLHGFPGNSRNLDLAQMFRMAGLASICFSYRGVWGSEGEYLLSHLPQDAAAVCGWVRQHGRDCGIDPDRIYLFGHSMGGFAAVQAIAGGLKVQGAFFMAPCDVAEMQLLEPERLKSLMSCKENGYFRLSSENAMEDELSQRAEEWYFPNAAKRMDLSIPYSVLCGKLDVSTPADRHGAVLARALRERGARVRYEELDDSHAFPASRFAVAERVIRFVRETEEGNV